MSIIARVTCDHADDRIGVAVSVPDPIASEWLIHHSYTSEIVLGERTWWYGGGGDLTEEPIGDDPPFCGRAWMTPWTGELELRLTIRLHGIWHDEDADEEHQQTWWWSGSTTLPAGATEHGFALRDCEPRRGPPFHVADVPAADTTHGPTLIPRPEHELAHSVNNAGAVLPGLGVYQPHSGTLHTESGIVQTPSFQPKGDCYLQGSFGGANGALAIVWNHRLENLGGGMQLTLVRLPHGEPRHTKLFDGFCTVHNAVWDPRGERLGAAIFGPRGMRTYVFDSDGRIRSDDLAPVGSDDLGWGGALEWSGDELLVTWTGTGDAPRAVEPGWRQYGAGLPTSRVLANGRRRTAWVVCAEFPRRPTNPGGTTIIAWIDDDEAHGHVVVPDHGWAWDRAFGNLAILDDGRIVAIGTKLWLVDPDNDAQRVVHLGHAGDYPVALPIHDGRLYNRGPGAWWTAIPTST